MRVLLDKDVAFHIVHAASFSKQLDIVSYGVGQGYVASNLLKKAQVRLLIGWFKTEEQLRARAFASWLANSGFLNVEVRTLNNCHAKIFIADGKALISSMNLSNGSNHEAGVLLSLSESEKVQEYFEACWQKAPSIVPFDLKAVAEVLATATF